MTTKKPAVSIGMPVFNGEAFIEQALGSLVAQTFREFEVIVSDNASDDKTVEICQAFSDEYDFIKVFRNDKNRGVSWNFNNTFNLSCGKYFMWLSHDDVLHERYIERCIEAIEARKDTRIVYSKIQVINADGDAIPFDKELKDLDDDDIAVRFRHCMSPQPYNQSVIYGLMRRADLAKTTLYGDFVAADRCLVAQLALRGKFYQIPEYLFYRREHAQNFRGDSENLRAHMPETMKWFAFPEWNVLRQHVRTVRTFPAPISVKSRLYYEIVRWSIFRGKKLGSEVLINIRQLLLVVARRIRK